jgi:restriction system protein
MAKKKTTAKKKARSNKSVAQGKTVAKPRKQSNGKLSGLDAAAQILAKAKDPMGCKDLVEQAIAAGLWSPGGKTPQATLYAAIIREIAKKGKNARFKKVARGRFRLAC